MSTKVCTKCDNRKDLEDFPKMSRSKDGRRPTCKDCTNEANRRYREANQEQFNKARRQHYVLNAEKLRDQSKTYRSKPESVKAKARYDKIYRKQNKQKIARQKKEWEYEKRSDPVFKIVRNMRRRLNHAVKGDLKSDRTFNLVGCSPEELKSHLESMFEEGMSWENYGVRGWHIDHKIPCCSFDMSDPEQQKKCFHYTNLQPLWAVDNLTKGSSLPIS